MDQKHIADALNRCGDVVRLSPQVVGRFYGDLNRLGQRAPDAPKPPYYAPERWIGSSTRAANPPHIPSGGESRCPDLKDVTLKELVADPELGPRLLGERRFASHKGTFRVLIKILDAGCPIPFHVHAADSFVRANPDVYPDERFGKSEAYFFFESPKGDCPYTHIGVHNGVGPREVISAMRRSTDHVLELSPGALQQFGEGFYTEAGLLHRPGTALTLEIQQPSDVYTMFQLDFGGEPLDEAVLHPGFTSLEEAAERVVDWSLNYTPDLLEKSKLRPQAVDGFNQTGAVCEWIYPPQVTDKFSGMRLTIGTAMTFKAADPCVLFVWQGRGEIDGRAVHGRAGAPTDSDEFFVGAAAAQRGLSIRNTGDSPLIIFALFAARA